MYQFEQFFMALAESITDAALLFYFLEALSPFPNPHDKKHFFIFKYGGQMTSFGSPGSGSVSQRYGFFYHQAVRHVTGNDKDYLRLIPRVVW
jgi:hypothetical protein